MDDRYAEGLADAVKREEAAIFAAMDEAFENAKERINKHRGEGDALAFYILEQIAITQGDAKRAIRALSPPVSGGETT